MRHVYTKNNRHTKDKTELVSKGESVAVLFKSGGSGDDNVYQINSMSKSKGENKLEEVKAG